MMDKIMKNIIEQITPPQYVFTTNVHNKHIKFMINTSYDTSHIDRSDPIARIILGNCLIECCVDHSQQKCKIMAQEDWQQRVHNDISNYMLSFLDKYSPQKNPRVTKLCRWMHVFTKSNIAIGEIDFKKSMEEIYRYLYSNINAVDKQIHIQNGLALLELLKAKYEAKGFTMEDRHVRPRHKRRRRY